MLVNNISIMLLAINWLAETSWRDKLGVLLRNKRVFIAIQIYLMVLIGLFLTQNQREARFELEKKLLILFMPLILGTSSPLTLAERSLVFKSFILSCIVASFICLGYAVHMNYKEDHTLTYVYNAIVHDIHLPEHYYYFNYWYFTYELYAKPLGMHPIYLSMYFVFSAYLSVYLWWGKNLSKSRKLALLGLLFFFFINIVMLASRMQMGVAALSLTIFILAMARRNGQLWKGLIFLAAISVIALFIIFKNPVIRERIIESNKPHAHYSENKYGEGGLSLRTYKWKYTWEAILLSPWFGTGTGDAQDALQERYQAHAFDIGYTNRFNAHNQYLQVWLEHGVLGLISLLFCWGYMIGQSLTTKSWLALSFIGLFMISCLTESMLEVNKGIAFYAFFSALLFFTMPEESPL